MVMNKFFHGLIVTSVMIGVLGISNARATPLVDFSQDNSGFTWFGNDAGCGAGCTLGYVFNVSSAVTIDGLGVYDAGSDGLNNTHELALWDNGGALLRSASVGAGATASDVSASEAGRYLYSDVATLTLNPGTYIVGGLFEVGDTDHVVFGAGGIFSNDAGAAYAGSAWINTGALQFPTNQLGSSDRYFGPTLRLASTAVPEPGVVVLLIFGLVGIFFVRRNAIT